MMLSGTQVEYEAVMEAAKLMMVPIRTAPKANHDVLYTANIDL